MLIFSTNTTLMANKKPEEELDSKFISKDKFAENIEAHVRKYNMNYIDAIVEYCSINGIELENVSKLISKPLKEKLRYDATELNYLKKKAAPKLPI